MLGALVILGWMIMQFGDRPARLFAPEMMPITLITERADGVAEGSIVSYRGVGVGRIGTIRRTGDGLSVQLDALIDVVPPPLPANLEGVIRSQVFGGSGQLSLQLTGPKPEGQLKRGANLRARYVGVDLLPPEFAQLATELTSTSKQFRETNLMAHLDQQVQKVGKILDSANELISDPKMREDVKAALANLRTASESAARLGPKLEQTTGQVSETLTDVRGTIAKTNTSIDTLTRQMNDRMLQVAKLLQNVESVTAKIDQGKGTAGALVNDPKLYQSLVETAGQLKVTVSDLNRLIEQWEQDGISFKMGK
jgi:phospholipid/cholesterol/gamma-HCH transport system substrate-binding protein